MIFGRRRNTSWQVYAPFSAWAALWASLMAGLAFALIDTGLGWALRGVSPSVPLRMTAAIVLGPATVTSSEQVDVGIALIAILLHTTLSVLYGTFLALMLPSVDRGWSVLIGGFYGLALYYVNFYGFNAFSPWFAGERDWLNIVSHFVFGAVLAYAYTGLCRRRPGSTIAPPSTRDRRSADVQGRNGFI